MSVDYTARDIARECDQLQRLAAGHAHPAPVRPIGTCVLHGNHPQPTPFAECPICVAIDRADQQAAADALYDWRTSA